MLTVRDPLAGEATRWQWYHCPKARTPLDECRRQRDVATASWLLPLDLDRGVVRVAVTVDLPDQRSVTVRSSHVLVVRG